MQHETLNLLSDNTMFREFLLFRRSEMICRFGIPTMLIKLVIVNLEECSYIQVNSGGGACIYGGCSYIQVNAGGGACIYGGCSYIQVNALILWRTHIYLSERSYIPASAHISRRALIYPGERSYIPASAHISRRALIYSGERSYSTRH